MNLNQLKKIYSSFGCDRLYLKRLSPNDNSKNQVYLGGSFDILNILPFSEITADNSGDWKRARFKAMLNFGWILENGKICDAPDTNLILYPKYPEVRLSGFLKHCNTAPSELFQTRIPGRILILGINLTGKVIAYAVSPDDLLTKELNKIKIIDHAGVFDILQLDSQNIDSRQALLTELRRINQKGWINSKRLNPKKEIVSCEAPNCGGYTLEAELGIMPNGYAEPDFLGWEIKQFNVPAFDRLENSIITLMTPEPTGGFYVSKGVDAFLLKYGYKDKLGRPDRINFGGIHYFNQRHDSTKLKLVLIGYDLDKQKIRNPDGCIALLDKKENITASWSFTSLLKHWKVKHAKASYVPSMNRTTPQRQYLYGNKIILGEGADFNLFLKQMADQHIYYDPGIKMEHVSGKHKIKRRSQFRLKSKYLPYLYEKNTIEDLNLI